MKLNIKMYLKIKLPFSGLLNKKHILLFYSTCTANGIGSISLYNPR
jgi:hypothetical protein